MTLSWYAVTVMVVGEPPERIRSAIPLFAEELQARSHLRKPSVVWDRDRQLLLITVEAEDLDADSAGRQISEEIFEIVPGLLEDFERFRVETEAVRTV